MVIDFIQNSAQYYTLHPGVKNALDYVKSCSTDTPDGRYELEDGLVATVSSGKTCDINERQFEVHEKYIDLQYIVAGEEILEIADISTLKPFCSYDAEKDFSLYIGDGHRMHLTAGTFYLLFPNDAHKGCCHTDKPTTFKKVVIKIPV